MKFQTTLTPDNKKEFVKSWVSVYQTGLLQLKVKREATDVGMVRPVSLYLIGLVLGYVLTAWGMQLMTTSFLGVEVLFGILVLFFIAFNLSYAFRSKWFSFLAGHFLLPKGPQEVEASPEGILFGAVDGEKTFWEWSSLTKAIPFARTLVLYNKDCNSYWGAKGHVLLINKDDLSSQEFDTLYNTYVAPLQIKNQFRSYYSYSDLIIFLIFCLLIALFALPYSLVV